MPLATAASAQLALRKDSALNGTPAAPAAPAVAGASTGAAPAPAAAAALQAESLSKRFGRQAALDGVSFSAPRGSVFGLFGDNGAGKTTAVRLLCGLLPPTSGRAAVLGMDAYAHAFRLRRLIGHLAQKVVLYPNLTLLQNMQLFGDLRGLSGADCRARFHELCARLEIDREASSGQAAGTLPLGVQRRAGLAFALLHRPEVLILDEPTSGIDGRDQLRLWEVLGEVSRDGTTVLVTSHHPEEAEYCDQVALLGRGRLLLCGEPSELKARHVGGARVRIEAPAPLPPLRQALEELGFQPEWSARPSGDETLRVFLPDYDEPALGRLRAALQERCPGASLRVDLPSMEQVFRETQRAAAAGK